MSEEEIAREGDRLLAQGAVLVSPAISPGERAIINNGLGEMAKPGGKLFDACASGKLLIISPFEHRNDYQPLTAECCRKMNALARAIATRQ